ncbi:helix-turn-helix domain-containing protein [Actinomadura livida]|uniref:Helix-turn-helix transcriptional regulator n=1 Tax=Actinomadura livida TaxID=79909 RepID=A0A7W7I800_9ACTN|nr:MULTISPECIES: helix-turn-helix transcriptional regulator [Actinomadura]MBB4771888.1 transcriptional regulator with XRE-family HTH domain [Actinomadura catellatispora]GGU03140.1 transcriptional regulator [Actinomadura livida]
MRRLGSELRKLRENAGYTIEQVADHLECSPSRVSRIETGKAQPPKQREIRDLLELFGTTDARIRDTLLQLAKEAAQPGWYSEFQDVFPPRFGSYIGLESEAAELRHFDNQLIHGLLQTPEYAREVLQTTLPGEAPETIDRLLELRLARQQILNRATPAFALWVVLDENVFRRPIGEATVMRGQVSRLLAAIKAPNITVQVLPFDKGAHVGLDGPFSLLGFPDPTDPDVVYVESQAGNAYLEQPHQVSPMNTKFNLLVASALDPRETAAFLHRIEEEMQ